ncbi:MAG: DEAD/DEAH box helicase family protein [Lentisphaeria bacterium]|nr:DEAD/DEAH box helicase family protein [Lentisphaeria bacterium]
MRMFDNIKEFVKDDLKQEIRPGSKISIAAACFSIYAYQELKEQLSQIAELRFIFTSPTFTTEHAPKEKREFYIPRLQREQTLCGSDFEIKLRNELTQKAIARECADWIRAKVKFKSNISGDAMQGFVNVANETNSTYQPFAGFTTVDLGCERGNNAFNYVVKLDAPQSQTFLQTFNSLWNDSAKMQEVTDVVIDNISVAYRENAPEFIYFVTLYNIFSEFLEDISEDVLPNEGVGFRESQIWKKLYDFQKDAALAIINKLEKYNGCILADSVGLGKTFSALAVIKYYENRNKNVLVLCPKKLASNWNTFKGNYVNNPIAGDRLRYDVLYHTDLSRTSGMSNGIELERLRWDTYDLIVIDESHNFRNGGNGIDDDDDDDTRRVNRYARLMNQVIRPGVRTKVLMLSATPVNNRFNDLKNQIALAYEGRAEQWDDKLSTTHSIDEIFRQAQKEFNAWSKLPAEERTADALLDRLDFDFFELLDSVTIARSRKHIERYYDTSAIGKFPTRLAPDSPRPALTTLPGAINYNEIYGQLQELSLMIYLPSKFIFPSARDKYGISEDSESSGLSQLGREMGIHHLMSVGLLKRLESSVYSFRLTLERIKELNEKTIRVIDRYEKCREADLFEFSDLAAEAAQESDEDAGDLFTVGRKVRIDLGDMDFVSWRNCLARDVETLELLISMVRDITPQYDNKLQNLLARIDDKIAHPINPGNKKIIVFTAFSDTAEYLYKYVSAHVTKRHGLHTAMITGDADGRSTVPKLRMDINTVLTLFSPVSKEKHLIFPNNHDEIDILIATDCISEGQNLQDCDYLINYDIHWNPVRLIQRFGRIDRIGSRNEYIKLVNYWPDMTLDDYIQLKDRVETRMKITVMTATGDDDPINEEDSVDLEYRRRQLERLQNEVVDIEEMNTGITIMDLGLNEFRLDLLDYVKNDDSCNRAPKGLHAVVPASGECPPGVIFVLRNVNQGVNIDKQNRLHPFYMVYLREDGEVVCHHLAPKKLLDTMRLLCKGKTEPLAPLCKEFNRETRDGKKMDRYSKLLGDAIHSIICKKEESDIDSLFSTGGTSALENAISGLHDFELICFLVVKEVSA